ncbi:gamma-glutamyltransferase [Alkalihalobacillus alcalophilus ATCC 27647 = CGMCC 1.3604]|uniref:Gamma-glutamyltransferase n=1 Tax=Alkalihalobacillus alcalophilus ATCC 27647 = CGMCC 1.3604 TaxID=1218173 RepID=A0A4S4JXU7_ALKAL|nr:gamma-glutamyltransferase family protein [Alkalihalobacillus alcalophilus]MED1560547.1 gamma-glutamyltransferase family protein [Alkalihalobacillus alcalophilus]THG90058.1 gamma-glutamyltransferase [Alkalihalobacillus alcalophilus ATCC 27647 = CGMCC 1.3604]
MQNIDQLNYPFQSQRMTTFAKKGMVATSQPLAAEAGLQILKQGGNAIDAAIATAACLTVVEPTSNGIGGDAFALVWTKGELHGLNSSGFSPKNISIEAIKERGYSEMPKHGWIPVTVPGAPAAWAELSKRFGKLPLTEVLKPAIEYAEEGFPISPVLGKMWARAYRHYKNSWEGEEFQNWFDTFAPNGRAPEIGEIWSSPSHAKSLRSIAESNGESFYRGELADKIAACSNQYNGFLTKEDLAAYKPEWVKPIRVNYRGYDVWEIPPNGQGLVALLALNTLKGYQFGSYESVDRYHKQIEAVKLAFADGLKYITEAEKMSVSVSSLLSEGYAVMRREKITDTAEVPEAGTPPKGGTVYLATADEEGNMVSFIQSNYMGFGSGIVVPGTGIALQNRGHNFSLDPNHDNRLEGGKRTFHTIIPGFLTKDDEAIGPFGVMGGFMQPQGHVQVIMNTIDAELNPQAALDAPRWQWLEDKKVMVEPHFPLHLAQELERKGHQVSVALDTSSFGRGQIIWRDPKTGVFQGGTEFRTDGAIAAW